MIVYSYFPQDARLRKEAEALVKAGYKIDIICFILPNVIIGDDAVVKG